MRDRKTYFARLKRSFIANRADARLAADRADGLGKLLAIHDEREPRRRPPMHDKSAYPTRCPYCGCDEFEDHEPPWATPFGGGREMVPYIGDDATPKRFWRCGGEQHGTQVVHGHGCLYRLRKERDEARRQRWETALLRGMIGALDQPTRAQVLEAAKRHGYLKRDESEDNDA